MRAITGGMALICGVFLATTGAAEEGRAPAFGVGNRSVYVISAWDMTPAESGETWGFAAGDGRYRYMTNSGQWHAGVQVPRGARITTIELEGCDRSPTGNLFAILQRVDTGSSTQIGAVLTSAAFTGGCLRLAQDLAVPETVDGSRYIVYAGNTSFDGETTLGAVRIFYDLQVSPAPASATFNDVPVSDPAFQFIEALVASGVTAGCGGGNYCPDSPVTRRQMAVFLAKLVGLNWPESVAP